MIRPINKNPLLLAIKSQPATSDDIQIGIDLYDTLISHRSCCVGMAANMIGISKRIIAVYDNGKYIVMFNPEILSCSDKYETEEGCLSLNGVKKTFRYQNIKVRFNDMKFKPCQKSYSGRTAQIIQHEIDHCNGILI